MTPRPPNTAGLIRRTQRWSDGIDGQAWPPQPPAAAFNPATGFPWSGDPEVQWPAPVADESVQAWAVGTPLNATLDQSWNLDDSERFVASTFVPDDTPGALGQPPLNASQKVAFDGDSEVPPYVPGQDDTPAPFVGVPLNAVQKQAWSDDTSEAFVQDQFRPDDTPAAFVGVPLNVTQLSAFNGDAEVAQAAPVADETIQPWAVQPVGAVAPFDPSAGFPWEQDASERFVADLFIPDDTIPPFVGVPLNVAAKAAFDGDASEPIAVPIDDPSVQAWAVGPPLNATQLSAFSVSDETLAGTIADDTAQTYSIQPPAFDPAAGFPWPISDDIVQPVWWTADETSQPWPVVPPVPFVGNVPQDAAIEPWVIDAISSPSWLAATSSVTVVTGGPGPNSGAAYSDIPIARAGAPTPSGRAGAPVPSARAESPKPQR